MQVAGLFPVQLAAHRALTAQARGRLQTRSLHTELVFALSGSRHVSAAPWWQLCLNDMPQLCRRACKGADTPPPTPWASTLTPPLPTLLRPPPHPCTPQIADSLKRFGLSDGSTSLLVGRFDATPADLQALAALAQGQPQPLSSLQSVQDVALIGKVWRCAAQAGAGAGA